MISCVLNVPATGIAPPSPARSRSCTNTGRVNRRRPEHSLMLVVDEQLARTATVADLGGGGPEARRVVDDHVALLALQQKGSDRHSRIKGQRQAWRRPQPLDRLLQQCRCSSHVYNHTHESAATPASYRRSSPSLVQLPESRLLLSRRLSHPAEPIPASPDFCSGSPASRSGSPRLGSPPATMEKRPQPAMKVPRSIESRT